MVKPEHREDTAGAIGLLIAGLGPIAVAGALVPFRDEINHTNVALVYVVIVVLAAACGGRWVGATAAVVSTLSFDFFFTRPYQRLTIASRDDIETTILLLAVGLMVGEIVVWANRARRARDRKSDEIAALRRVADQVAKGSTATAVREFVEGELIALLSLRDCVFEQLPYRSKLPRMQRSGSVDTTTHRFVRGGFALPKEGVEIAVLSRGDEVGRLVLMPDPDVGISIEERVVAIALADQLGAALATGRPNHTKNGATA
jgi:K+-sensing histidine kinase KdpD